jgi:hypothetical protein
LRLRVISERLVLKKAADEVLIAGMLDAVLDDQLPDLLIERE